jgi:hypothetical protein
MNCVQQLSVKRVLLRLQVESEINYNAQCIQKYILGCHIA